jgi:tetratricopeptide (TPR) repeat protein
LELSQSFSDRIAEGKILNNLGFEYLRSADYSRAKRSFKKSISILKESQAHEQAFPHSNLAVVNMIDCKWEEALKSILDALCYNKSTYASLVLKTNRMICYYNAKNIEWETLHRELYEYIMSAKGIDDKIYKKICVNLAIISAENNFKEEAIVLLEHCKPFLKHEKKCGLYRYFVLRSSLLNENSDDFKTSSVYSEYHSGFNFEPWLLNFTHD